MNNRNMTLGSLQKRAGGHSTKIKVLTMADLLPKKAMKEHMKAVEASRVIERRTFNDVDALCAEILARFGWETYEKWNNFEISNEKMAKLLAAERSREYNKLTQLEMVIVSSVAATVRRYKNEPKPRGLENANKIIKDNYKIIKGTK